MRSAGLDIALEFAGDALAFLECKIGGRICDACSNETVDLSR